MVVSKPDASSKGMPGHRAVWIPEDRYNEFMEILNAKGKPRPKKVDLKANLTVHSGGRRYDVKAALQVRDDLRAKLMSAVSGGPGLPGAPCSMVIVANQPSPGELVIDFGCEGRDCGPTMTCHEMGIATPGGLAVVYCMCR